MYNSLQKYYGNVLEVTRKNNEITYVFSKILINQLISISCYSIQTT